MSVTHTTEYHKDVPNKLRFQTIIKPDGTRLRVDTNMHPKILRAQEAHAAKRPKEKAKIDRAEGGPVAPTGFSQPSEDELRKAKEDKE